MSWKCNLNNVLKPHALCFSTDKEDGTPNPFYDKYANKIKLVQQRLVTTLKLGFKSKLIIIVDFRWCNYNMTVDYCR